ncbi:MAG TPA: MBL fold metallo-hydrolase [Acetobacteraceae bacterium]|jgi:N-acyl homoserine lactone hydrolase|nr:MBL fold metallo-hydrolase [Acetobacteraceae bacterium]
MTPQDYQLDILVQGYPGKSVCHGGLGWSTIVLLRGAARVALVDCGTFSHRANLLAGLQRHGLGPSEVTDVILTHSHHDHAINWVLFDKAMIWLGADEIEWAVKEPWGRTPVPELYVRELKGSQQLRVFRHGDTIIPGMVAYDAPGHTPGHMIFVLSGTEHDVIFTGDAAKNRAELLTRSADMTYDPAVTKASIDAMWDLWRRRANTLLVPGHDMPMVLQEGQPVFVGKREAAITSWFGDDLDTMTRFELVVER